MSYFDGFTPVCTFRLQIEREDRTVLDSAITVKATDGEISRAKKTIQELLSEYAPAAERPEPTPPNQEESRSEESGPETKLPPPVADRPHGAKGLMKLHCPDCGNRFGVFLKDYQEAINCKCGHLFDLTAPLARFYFTCPYCEKEAWGKTNAEDAGVTIRCVCGGDIDLEWDPEHREYRN